MRLRLIARVEGSKGTAKVYWSHEMAEYSVHIVGAPPTTGYYTDSKSDALQTAQHMANTWSNS